MLWLQTPQWGRWLLAIAIATVALWVEFRPESTVEHLFASREIMAGETVGPDNTQSRRVQADLFEPIQIGGVALDDIGAGDPVLDSDLGQGGTPIANGWWTIELPVPDSASRGDRARLVLLDSGTVVDAVVTAATSDDPLGSGLGNVAVDPEHAAEVAAAAANGRLAILIEAG